MVEFMSRKRPIISSEKNNTNNRLLIVKFHKVHLKNTTQSNLDDDLLAGCPLIAARAVPDSVFLGVDSIPSPATGQEPGKKGMQTERWLRAAARPGQINELSWDMKIIVKLQAEPSIAKCLQSHISTLHR